MKHSRILWSLLVIATVTAMLLSACAGAAPTAAPKAEPTKAPAQPTAAPKPAEPTKAPAAPAAKVAPGSIWNKDEYEKTAGVKIEKYGEAPALAELVKAGKLPPVEQRLPKNPLVKVPWSEVGQYGGNVRWDEYTID